MSHPFQWLRRPKTRIWIDVGLPPSETERRLRSAIGQVRSFLLSPTWGRTEELVGRVENGRIRARVRHGYSNGLTRLLYGRVASTPEGSRIEGEFRTLWWVVLILRTVWLAILLPLLAYLFEVARRGQSVSPAVPPGPLLTLALLVGVEAIGRRMGDRDEERMREVLSRLFADASVR